MLHALRSRHKRVGSAHVHSRNTLAQRHEALLRMVSPRDASDEARKEHFFEHMVLACMQDNNVLTKVRCICAVHLQVGTLQHHVC